MLALETVQPFNLAGTGELGRRLLRQSQEMGQVPLAHRLGLT